METLFAPSLISEPGIHLTRDPMDSSQAFECIRNLAILNFDVDDVLLISNSFKIDSECVTGLRSEQLQSLIDHSKLYGDPVVVLNAALDDRVFNAPLALRGSKFSFVACMKLSDQGGVHSDLLCICGVGPRRQFSPDEQAVFQQLANLLSVARGGKPISETFHGVTSCLPSQATVNGLPEASPSARLTGMAHGQDSLTGLHNRESLLQALQARINRNPEHRRRYALLFLDIDGFKRINDSLGHIKADAVLVEVGRRLGEAVDGVPGTMVARLGGDEFVVLMSDVAEEEDVVTFGGMLEFLLRVPIPCGGQQVFVSASVGVVFGAIGAYTQAFRMLEDCDLAMYRAKASGKARCVTYSESMRNEARNRLALEMDLRCGLREDQFEVHYQPKVILETGRVKGFEALVRWHHPTRGFVSPDVFIPIAEEIGLIGEIGRWVAKTAIAQLATWRQSGVASQRATMAINVSSCQFHESDLLDWITEQLIVADVPFGCLVLEITERLLIEDVPSSLKLLHRIVDAGIGLDLDDFGTGYSSLSYLHRFPFRSIKLDHSFIKHMGEDQQGINLVTSIVALAASLGMRVIAEGVETSEQASRLRRMGCPVAQGYLFSPALTASDMEACLLKSKWRLGPRIPSKRFRVPKPSKVQVELRHN